MSDSGLRKYIDDAMAAGSTKEQIKSALVGAGWDPAMVDVELGVVNPPMSVPSPVVPAVGAAASSVGSPTPEQNVVALSGSGVPGTIVYAGWWRKSFAGILDVFLSGLPLFVVLSVYPVIQYFIGVQISADTSSVVANQAGQVNELGLTFAKSISEAPSKQSGLVTALKVINGILSLLGLLSVIWLGFLYRPLLEGKKGATWGMKLLGLRIVRLNEPTRVGIGFWLSVGRLLIDGLAAPITGGLSYNWMLMDVKRRHLADIICKTVVLHDPQKKFAFVSLEEVPARKKQIIWFVILALLAVPMILGTIGTMMMGK